MAENLIFLRRRIKSVKNTQKLTKAMKTVAAAKLRRASGELKRSHAYREKIASLLRLAATRASSVEPLPEGTDSTFRRLLHSDGRGAALLVVVAGDKGLCGGFNSHVLKNAEARYRELTASGEAALVTVGVKAERYFAKRGLTPKKTYGGLANRLQFADAVRLASDLQQLFLAGGFRFVEFAFSEFVTASRQQFVVRRLFPIELESPTASEADADAAEKREETIFEPDADTLFQALLPRHVQALVYQFLLQSVAAEQMARMTAMELATRNAGDMIRNLTLRLNKMRQAAITNELLEIITATEALNK